MIIDGSSPVYRRRSSPTVPAGDHLTRSQRANANRLAAQAYYYRGVTNAGFLAQAPDVAGVSPVPAFGMLTDEQNAALTASARMALVNIPYYRNLPQAAIDAVFPQFAAGTAKAVYNNYVPGGRTGALPNFSAVYAGTGATSEVPLHEISHRFDFRFGSPSQQPGFSAAVTAAGASNQAFGNKLGVYNQYAAITPGRGEANQRELYADIPSRLAWPVPQELRAYYPWLR